MIFQSKSWFLKKEYSEKLIEKEMRRLNFYEEETKTTKGVKGIPFVVMYHPN